MPRPGSTAPPDGSDSASDSDDLFGTRRRAAEEAALRARRARLKSAKPAAPPASAAAAPPPPPPPPQPAAQRPSKRARTHDAAAVFDMFAADLPPPPLSAPQLAPGADAAVEPGGYARLRPGDVLCGGKYVVESGVGQGVFASVFRCRAVASGQQVAIKVSRANAAMRRAAARELATLRLVQDADASGRSCIVRVLDDFVHRVEHSAIVFEYLDASLRAIVRQHVGGVRLAAARLYAAQLLRALVVLARLSVVHADVKPDNVLVSADRSAIRLADFGCAVPTDDAAAEPSAYLAARFYRAPETILGHPPAPSIDVWAAGCVLYELYTGNVAFPGASNNEMLALFMAARGPIPMRVLRRGRFRTSHFDEDHRFLKRERDPVSGVEGVRVVPRAATNGKSNPIRERIVAAAQHDDEKGNVALFADLLDSMLVLDPAKRISPADALRMPLFQMTVKGSAKKKGSTTSGAKNDG